MKDEDFYNKNHTYITYEELNESEKIRLLNKLNNLNAKWSNDYLKNQGSVNVTMVQTERDIRSTRNAIKYEDVQENLRATG